MSLFNSISNKLKLLGHLLGALVVYTIVFSSLQSKNTENYTIDNPFFGKKQHSHSCHFSIKHNSSTEFFFIEIEEKTETETNNHSENNAVVIHYNIKRESSFSIVKRNLSVVFQYTSYKRLQFYDLYCCWKNPSVYTLLS
ncbi:MAG: hypothetical protein H6584_06850 [Flavobacteriales bacterium]|nr:hypothetical protein [Flavobacteriales bacterium]